MSNSITDPHLIGFIKWCCAERERTAGQIVDFESGRLSIGFRPVTGEYVDMTLDHVTHLKEVIENMDGLIARYETPAA